MENAVTSTEQGPDSGISSTLLALAAVANRLGVDVSVDQIRRRFALPPGEPDTATIIALAREIGLEAKALTMKFQELPKLGRVLPAILRSKDGGALILEDARSDPAKGTVVVIRDPGADGNVVVAIDELHLAEVWQGEAILVKRRFAASDDEQPFGMLWIFGQVLREKKMFKAIGTGAFVSTVFSLAPPFMFMIVIDRVLANQSYSTLNVLFGTIVFLMLFETWLTFLRGVLTQVATTRLDGRINLYLVEKLLKLPMDYFEQNPTGRILSKLGSIYLIRTFLTGQIFGAMLDIIPLLLVIPACVFLEWHLTLLAVVLSTIIFVIVASFMKPIGRAHKKVVDAEQAKWAHLTETIYGMRTIKSLALEGRRRREWDTKVATVTDFRHAFGLLINHPKTWSLPFERLTYSGCFAAGAYEFLMVPGSITAGQLVAFAMLSRQIASPLLKLANLQLDMAELGGAVHQIASIMNYPPEESRPNGLRLPIRGEVSFKDVSFRYSAIAPYALQQVSFTVPAGTMLGIMGRSGSGKTTVTRLLQRLCQNYEGMIKIDGMDLREVDLMHLRTNIGVVPQENFLFSGTIRENIAMAKPDASFADVVKAAQMSGAEEFIERLPRGYETELEEGATNLSGGQRQRLALARALLIDPPVLILDEATSALDAESEAIVNANLKRMAKGRTVLSISHRLSMLVECDSILVLERGTVYDLGTHEELLRRCDIYKHMWYQQNRHLNPEDDAPRDKPVLMPRGVAR
jgi:ATP-binding cassette subfamily B protein